MVLGRDGEGTMEGGNLAMGFDDLRSKELRVEREKEEVVAEIERSAKLSIRSQNSPNTEIEWRWK